jgi:hypothetical protein
MKPTPFQIGVAVATLLVWNTASLRAECLQSDIDITGMLPVDASMLENGRTKETLLDFASVNARDASARVCFRSLGASRYVVELGTSLASLQPGAQEEPHYSAATVLDFGRDGRQQTPQQVIVQPISGNPDAANSLVVVTFTAFVLGQGQDISSISRRVVPCKCEPLESVATVQQINGSDDTVLLDGIHNPPGGDLYDPKKH